MIRTPRHLHGVFGLSLFVFLIGILPSCGGGGGGGGGIEIDYSQGDPSFFLEEIYFGRPLHDGTGTLDRVVNPASVIEVDPITGLVLEGYPRTLYTGDDLEDLYVFGLTESPLNPYKPKLVPRNAALVLEFTFEPDPASLMLDGEGYLTVDSPIQVFTEAGTAMSLKCGVIGKRVLLDPTGGEEIGFPASPRAYDEDGHARLDSEGYLRIAVGSEGLSNEVLLSADGRKLHAREDLLGTDAKPVGFNPGNGLVDFIHFGSMSFNGCLPDLTPPRIYREVDDQGTTGTGSDAWTVTVPGASYVTAANGGAGEWAGALLILRPGMSGEERVEVANNTGSTLYLKAPFVVPPDPGTDDFRVVRAEFFEPIDDLSDLTTAVDPEGRPKDPDDPQDALNGDLFNFLTFETYDAGVGAWQAADPSSSSGDMIEIDPMCRFSIRFSEPMDPESFRPYENFLVTSGALSIEDPGFDLMKPGRIITSYGGREVRFEPVIDDPYGISGDRIVGFGGTPKTLRFVIRVLPSEQAIEDFYEALGAQQNTWPSEVIPDLAIEGVLSIHDVGGRPLALPDDFLDLTSPYCVIDPESPGRGPFRQRRIFASSSLRPPPRIPITVP